MDQLLVLARVAQPRLRSALHLLSIALVAAAAGCGSDDEPASDEDRAAEVAKEYVHTHSNNEEAKCADTLASGVDDRLCDDLGPLVSRVNPEAKKTRMTGPTAIVTVTGAATTLIDVTLVKQGGEWKVQSWRGYAPGGGGESGSGGGGGGPGGY